MSRGKLVFVRLSTVDLQRIERLIAHLKKVPGIPGMSVSTQTAIRASLAVLEERIEKQKQKLKQKTRPPRSRRVYLIVDKPTGTVDHLSISTDKRYTIGQAAVTEHVAAYDFVEFVGDGKRVLVD